jgi:copper chaperone NosL
MVSRRRFLAMVGAGAAVTAVGAVGVAALPSAGTDEDGLPNIRYGAERCARCGMVIDDPRFAAAWTAPRAGGMHFDDIGCLVRDLEDRAPLEGIRYFVHDYETEAWLDATSAVYVVSPEIRSPMAYGVAAFSSKAAAERVAASLAVTVQTWAGLAEAPGNGHA